MSMANAPSNAATAAKNYYCGGKGSSGLNDGGRRTTRRKKGGFLELPGHTILYTFWGIYVSLIMFSLQLKVFNQV